MPIAFNCSCGERLEVDDELAGKQARCPYCEAVVGVPDGTPPPAKRARLADPDETDDDRGAYSGSLNPDDRSNRRESEYRPRRSSYDRDDDDPDYRPRRNYQPAPYNPMNKQVVGGIVSVIIGVVATVIMLFLGRMCFWGLIISVFGVIAIIRGLASGRDN